MNNRTGTFLILMILMIGVVIGFLVGKAYNGEGDRKTTYARMQKLKDLKEVKLTSMRFDEVVMLTDPERNGRLKLMLVVPAKVTASVNMEEVGFSVNKNGIIEVKLPTPTLKRPVFDLEKAVNYDLQKKLDIPNQREQYNVVIDELQAALADHQELVMAKASGEGMMEYANNMAKLYIRNFAKGYGYQVRFVGEGK